MTPLELEKRLPHLQEVTRRLGLKIEPVGPMRLSLDRGTAELWFEPADRNWYARLLAPVAGMAPPQYREVCFDVVDVTLLYVLDHWFGKGKQLEKMKLKKR